MLRSLLALAATVLTALALPALGDGSTNATSAIELGKRQVNSRYIFTAFTTTSESNLCAPPSYELTVPDCLLRYVYTSTDGTSWSLLAGPTYTPSSGLIRDPSVIYHTECVMFSTSNHDLIHKAAASTT